MHVLNDFQPERWPILIVGKRIRHLKPRFPLVDDSVSELGIRPYCQGRTRTDYGGFIHIMMTEHLGSNLITEPLLPGPAARFGY